MRSLIEKEYREYFFTTSVSTQSEKDQFLLDFYPIENGTIHEDTIVRTTKNFDELIDFLEEKF